MQLLTRPGTPACLANYVVGHHVWGKGAPTVADRATIWASLVCMQANLCAYCESEIEEGDRHIEHFKSRSSCPSQTFSWANLFGSCMSKDSCGCYKDDRGKPYNSADLVKPDVEDPDRFFIFVSDGSIAVREASSAIEKHRASETLRVFNLDERGGTLRAKRRAAARGFLDTMSELLEMAGEFSQDELSQLVDGELSQIMGTPFSTVKRHALIGSLP